MLQHTSEPLSAGDLIAALWSIFDPGLYADRYYLQVTDEHFQKAVCLDASQRDRGAEKAAQNAAQYSAAMGRKEGKETQGETKEPLDLQGYAAPCESVHEYTVPRRGVEPLSPP